MNDWTKVHISLALIFILEFLEVNVFGEYHQICIVIFIEIFPQVSFYKIWKHFFFTFETFFILYSSFENSLYLKFSFQNIS